MIHADPSLRLLRRSKSEDLSNSYDEEDDDSEILGTDDDEQEDPRDYCKGERP